MKITLSAVDNSYTLNFEGSISVSPKKTGMTKVRTLGGRLKVRWRSEYNEINVNIDYLTEDNYNILKFIWGNLENQVLLHGNNTTYIGIITNDTLNMTSKYDSEGNVFYTGSITIED